MKYWINWWHILIHTFLKTVELGGSRTLEKINKTAKKLGISSKLWGTSGGPSAPIFKWDIFPRPWLNKDHPYTSFSTGYECWYSTQCECILDSKKNFENWIHPSSTYSKVSACIKSFILEHTLAYLSHLLEVCRVSWKTFWHCDNKLF